MKKKNLTVPLNLYQFMILILAIKSLFTRLFHVCLVSEPPEAKLTQNSRASHDAVVQYIGHSLTFSFDLFTKWNYQHFGSYYLLVFFCLKNTSTALL